MKSKLKTVAWAFRTAWRIDKRTMLLWYALSALLAVLPAVALKFNQQSLSVISGFLGGGAYSYADAAPPIIGLGALMIAIGLSARINGDLIYLMMYDTYYIGTCHMIMDNIQRVDMTDLLKKDINDAWNFCYLRAGSLTDFLVGACTILSKVISIAALLAVAFGVSRLIFAISIVYTAGVFVLSFSFMGQIRRDERLNFQNDRMVEYYEKLSESPGMAKEARIYENTDAIVSQWRKPFNDKLTRDKRKIKAASIRDFVSGAAFYVFLIITVGVSVAGVTRGAMTPDAFLVLFTLCLNLYNTVSGTAGHIVRFDSGLDALDKQRRFFEIAPMHDPEADAGKAGAPADENTVFEADGLTFSYADKPAIKGISFKVNKGEVVALVGANGSGKSTLVKLLLDMYKPDGGTLKLFGREFGEYKRDFLRSKIGVFFQNYYIFHSPLRENVGVGAVEDMDDEAKIREAIRLGGAERVVEKLPRGIDTLLGKFQDPTGTELSGGEKQRVASARAYMSNRDVLIFDEPASMLDPIAEMEQFTNIQKLLDGRTAILISHRVGFARMADKIIMLNDGELAETGTHGELMAKGGLYAKFFNEQAQWYNTASAAKGDLQNG
ncbi:MAG: ABC transporter ATP-binding protein/permease [Oscillospiraceae bacterium]|jgi:ABC-type multidrug transport system fused ATPase/permease subunit|nr:ABC transporter ATP-binding protein/permease [Oscillospiraceae bacterium]